MAADVTQNVDITEPSRGRSWVLGDNIDTDVLAPGQYIKLPMEELAQHCLESVDVGFAGQVKAGDIVVAGSNFGIGSSREQAAQALRVLGVAAVVAESFGGIFFRNAINLGLPVFTPVKSASSATAVFHLSDIKAGEPISLDLQQAMLVCPESGIRIELQALPDFLMDMLRAGGLVAVLEKRFNPQS